MKRQSNSSVRIASPSALVAAGIAAGRHDLGWVRGTLVGTDAERTPHLSALRAATLSHKRREETRAYQVTA